MAGAQIGEDLLHRNGRAGIGERFLDPGPDQRIERRLLAFERAQSGADDLAQ